MAISVKRTRIHGIAIEETAYGSGESAPTFALPALEFDYTPVIQQGRNTSMYGSNFELNDMINDVRMTEFSGQMKVSEDIFPLVMSSMFTISSTTVSGESSVYEHTLDFSVNNNSFTLFVQDEDRGSEYIAGAKFTSLSIEVERGDYLKLNFEGMGKFPVTWGGSVTLTERKEFASKALSMQWTPQGSGFNGNAAVTSATINHTLNFGDDEDNYDLGSEDFDRLVPTTVSLSSDVTARYTNKTERDYFKNGDYRATQFTIVDTAREITGSTQSTNPLIRMTMPSTTLTSWQENGGANDVLKQDFTIEALNMIGVTNAPETIIVRNATASYGTTPAQ